MSIDQLIDELVALRKRVGNMPLCTFEGRIGRPVQMTHDKDFANICAFLDKYRLTAHTKLNGTIQLRDKATRRVLSKPELRTRLKGK